MKAIDWILCTMAGLSLLAWMDTLWIFGIEDSQAYTWWGLIHYFGN